MLSRMRHLRLLIVDDDAEFLRVAFRYFSTAGRFECLSAERGAEALTLCARQSPDAVLLDLRLKDISGFHVLRALRLDPRTSAISVIAMTGESKAADLIDAASDSLGATILHKPFDFADAAKRLRAAVRASRASRANPDPNVLVRGELRIDLRRRQVFFQDSRVPLGPSRFEVLCALARSKDGLPERILGALVWGPGHKSTNTVAQTIHRLRADLRRATGLELIVSIPGGYKLQ